MRPYIPCIARTELFRAIDVDNFGTYSLLAYTIVQVTHRSTCTAHIGGFLVGLLTGIILYPIISPTRRHQIIVWVCRLVAIALIVVLYVVLIRNFYKSDPYSGEYSLSDFRELKSKPVPSVLLVSIPIVLPDVFEQPLSRVCLFFRISRNK